MKTNSGKLSAQELFDKVLAHARAQRRRATTPDGSCRYRLPDGRKCFIGALIPGERYSREFEGRSVYNPAIRFAAGIPSELLVLARELQRVHDALEPEDWEQQLAIVAEEFDLEFHHAQ